MHRQLLSKGYLAPISHTELCSEGVPDQQATVPAAQAEPLPLNRPELPSSCLHTLGGTSFQGTKGLKGQWESSVCRAPSVQGGNASRGDAHGSSVQELVSWHAASCIVESFLPGTSFFPPPSPLS